MRSPAIAGGGIHGWLGNLRYPEYDTDHFKNLNNCSLVYSLPIPQTSWKSKHTFFSYSANKQTRLKTLPSPTCGRCKHKLWYKLHICENNISCTTAVLTNWCPITLDAVYCEAWWITNTQPLIADVNVLDRTWTCNFLHSTIALLCSVQFIHVYCPPASNAQTCRGSLSCESCANECAAAILLQLNTLDLVVLQHCHWQQPHKPLPACSRRLHIKHCIKQRKIHP